MARLALPYKYAPREYQLPFWQAMATPYNPDGKKRAVLVRHRRAGKDKDAFNYMVMMSFHRVGVYYYFFPSYAQGRKALWDNVDAAGFKFLDHIPKELVAGQPNQTEMKVQLKNGSIIQVVGSDNIDTVVGSNPVGCVFSEYALQDPSGYNLVRPILRENGGWAIFTYTPRGKNHGHDLFEMAQKNPEWYCERLTATDTFKMGGTVSPGSIEEERLSGMSENLIQQEYFCSPAGTRIWTDRGQRPIEDICLGDTVLSHAGRWRKVTKLFRHENAAPMVEIASAGSPTPLVCTENHPIRICNPATQTYSWVAAKDVKPGQYVTLARLKRPTEQILDAGMAELVAWYIAEGSVARTAVQFSLHVDETEFAQRIMHAATRFGKVRVFESPDSLGQNVVVNSSFLSDFLVTHCGSGAASKRIPWGLIAGNEQTVYETLIDGDGCRGDYHGPNEVFTTISYGLALDVQMLAHMLGKRASVNIRPGGRSQVFPHGNTSVCADSYSVRMSVIRKTPNGKPKILPQKHGVAAWVTSVKAAPACAEVFNFAVQYDESYVAEGRVVHNCSFDAAVEHAVFGEQMLLARKEGRVTRVPYQKGLSVNTTWDIGRDTVAIWFWQTLRGEVRFIDYHSAMQSELSQEVKLLAEKPYTYGTHYMPHDADYRDYKTNTTPKEVAAELGLPVEVLPKTFEHAHINAARMMFNRCWFDEEKCQNGLNALQNWHFEWDEKTRMLSKTAIHDWSSHGAKAFSYVAVAHEPESEWTPAKRYEQKQKRSRSWMSA